MTKVVAAIASQRRNFRDPIDRIVPYCDFLQRTTTMVIPMAGHRPANPPAAQPGTSPKAAVELGAH